MEGKKLFTKLGLDQLEDFSSKNYDKFIGVVAPLVDFSVETPMTVAFAVAELMVAAVTASVMGTESVRRREVTQELMISINDDLTLELFPVITERIRQVLVSKDIKPER